MTVLSVNVNKVAVLRNSRGGDEPRVDQAAETAIRAGAGSITVHPRPDQRHIRPSDVDTLARLVAGRVESTSRATPSPPLAATTRASWPWWSGPGRSRPPWSR